MPRDEHPPTLATIHDHTAHIGPRAGLGENEVKELVALERGGCLHSLLPRTAEPESGERGTRSDVRAAQPGIAAPQGGRGDSQREDGKVSTLEALT